MFHFRFVRKDFDKLGKTVAKHVKVIWVLSLIPERYGIAFLRWDNPMGEKGNELTGKGPFISADGKERK